MQFDKSFTNEFFIFIFIPFYSPAPPFSPNTTHADLGGVKFINPLKTLLTLLLLRGGNWFFSSGGGTERKDKLSVQTSVCLCCVGPVIVAMAAKDDHELFLEEIIVGCLGNRANSFWSVKL